MHPGNGDNDYLNPSTLYDAGSYQGDTPIGTLTSQSFVIMGDTITFLIGGGCNPLIVYVSLIIDGNEVDRATGRCTEAMNEAIWDVSTYRGRVGRIIIVDNSQSDWGHINVDHFQFSWPMNGGAVVTNGEAISTSLPILWSMVGSVYTFGRKNLNTLIVCTANPGTGCDWVFQSKLVPSDYRPGELFGYDVSVDDTTGVLVVGTIK